VNGPKLPCFPALQAASPPSFCPPLQRCLPKPTSLQSPHQRAQLPMLCLCCATSGFLFGSPRHRPSRSRKKVAAPSYWGRRSKAGRPRCPGQPSSPPTDTLIRLVEIAPCRRKTLRLVSGSPSTGRRSASPGPITRQRSKGPGGPGQCSRSSFWANSSARRSQKRRNPFWTHQAIRRQQAMRPHGKQQREQRHQPQHHLRELPKHRLGSRIDLVVPEAAPPPWIELDPATSSAGVQPSIQRDTP